MTTHRLRHDRTRESRRGLLGRRRPSAIRLDPSDSGAFTTHIYVLCPGTRSAREKRNRRPHLQQARGPGCAPPCKSPPMLAATRAEDSLTESRARWA